MSRQSGGGGPSKALCSMHPAPSHSEQRLSAALQAGGGAHLTPTVAAPRKYPAPLRLFFQPVMKDTSLNSELCFSSVGSAAAGAVAAARVHQEEEQQQECFARSGNCARAPALSCSIAGGVVLPARHTPACLPCPPGVTSLVTVLPPSFVRSLATPHISWAAVT